MHASQFKLSLSLVEQQSRYLISSKGYFFYFSQWVYFLYVDIFLSYNFYQMVSLKVVTYLCPERCLQLNDDYELPPNFSFTSVFLCINNQTTSYIMLQHYSAHYWSSGKPKRLFYNDQSIFRTIFGPQDTNFGPSLTL